MPLAVLCQLGAFAQSALINIPTTDVLPPKQVYVEVNYLTHPMPYDKAGFQSFGPRINYGLFKNVEIGVNFYYTFSSSPDAAEIQPNAKWQFFSDEDSGTAGAIGGLLRIPLRNRASTNLTAMLYATLSKQIKARLGPRVTTGAYTIVGPVAEGETRGGVVLGYEQPIKSKFSFVADWFSGYNSFGYASAGLSFTLPKQSYLYAGYSFGNQGRGNNWLGIFFGRTF